MDSAGNWHAAGRREGAMMSQHVFSFAAGAAFLLIAMLHVLRLIFAWEAVLDGRVMPMWMSWVAVLVAGYLAVQGFRLSRRRHTQRDQDGRVSPISTLRQQRP
ncbi:MAG: hypothetical protein ACRD2Q_04765 [Terriglobales bacterium]